MKLYAVLTAAVVAGLFMASTAERAHAWCGVIEKSARGKTAEKAVERAEARVFAQVRKLRGQNGKKLKLSNKSMTCLGGPIAIDDKGNEIVGSASCTVTQPFCVNP